MRCDGIVWLVCLVWVVFGKMAFADQWNMTSSLDQGVEYDDNIAMRADATPAFGYLLKPSLSANWSTEIMEIGLNGQGDIRRYDDESWNCDNFSLGHNQRYIQHQHVFSFAGGYSQSCTYSQQSADTGILVPNNQSESYNLSPAWTWQWSPQDRVSLSPSYSDTSYSAVGSSFDNASGNQGFQSNSTYSVNLSEKHEWNRRLSFNGSLSYSHSEYSSLGGSTQNVSGFQLGGEYAITREWSINAGGGGRWVQRPLTDSSSGDSGSDSVFFTQVADLSLNYTGQSMDYVLSYSRSVNPSAFGQALEYNTINMRYGYRLTRELSFNIDGSYLKSQSVGQSSSQNTLQNSAQDRNYYTASTGLVWKFAKEWQLSANYRYRRQEYPDVQAEQNDNLFAGAQESNAFMLHLNYNWDGFRVSR